MNKLCTNKPGERASYYMSLTENATQITINQSLKERSEQITLEALYSPID